MATLFADSMVRFQYPENWQVDRQETDEGWTITVQSPGTAFLMINGYTERPDIQDVLTTALQAMQQDYPELESEPATERISSHSAKGYDINFFSLDTLNTCQLRSFRTTDTTILILSQSSSFDSPTTLAVLDAIRTTLHMNE